MLNPEFMPYLAGTLLLLVISWAFLMNRVTRLLRRQHPLIYDQLGRPAPFRNSPSTSLRFLSFLVNGKYRALDNPKLTTSADAARIFLFAYLLVFVSIVAYFVLGNLGGR